MFFRKKNSKESLLKRVFRSFFTIIILAALLLVISFTTKFLATLDSEKLYSYGLPVLSRLNIDEDTTGEVAGQFVERIENTGIVRDNNPSSDEKVIAEQPLLKEPQEAILQVAILADSENDFEMLQKSLTDIKSQNIKHLIHLGDLTDWGDIESLETVKNFLIESNTFWHVLPGDLDLGQSVGRDNFIQVFGTPDELFNIDDLNFMLFDNSANFTEVEANRLSWFQNNINDVDILLLSRPLYHPLNSRVMGVVNGEDQPKVVGQKEEILELVRNSGVKFIIAADQHQSSKNIDPEKKDLTHYVVGALTSSRNIQTPRYSILTCYKDKECVLEDRVL